MDSRDRVPTSDISLEYFDILGGSPWSQLEFVITSFMIYAVSYYLCRVMPRETVFAAIFDSAILCDSSSHTADLPVASNTVAGEVRYTHFTHIWP
jgi:hypothetical protein